MILGAVVIGFVLLFVGFAVGYWWAAQKKENPLEGIQQTFAEFKEHVDALESKRETAYVSITKDINNFEKMNEEIRKSILRETDKVGGATKRLGDALRRPQIRGSWGEMQLENTLQLAGMQEGVDYERQPTGEEGALRPDTVIHLPGDGVLVVDVKTPLDAYLEAVEAETDEEREKKFQAHVRHVRSHLKTLAGKEYWRVFSKTPEFVIMFIPNEAVYMEAMHRDKTLFSDAYKEKVLFCSPTNMVALAKTVAYVWQQEKLANKIEEVQKLGQEFYKRLATFLGHLAKMGASVNKTTKDYNAALGSLERWVLPAARRFSELGVVRKQEVLPEPQPVDRRARVFSKNQDSESQDESHKQVLTVLGDGVEQDGGEQTNGQDAPKRDFAHTPNGDSERAQNATKNEKHSPVGDAEPESRA